MGEAKLRMQKTFEGFERQLTTIRSGTVSPGLVDAVRISYYGQSTPLSHIALVSVVNHSITVTPHDPSILGVVEKALKACDLHAYMFSKSTIVVSIPPVTGEEKERIRAFIRKLGEEAKIAIRSIRKICRQGAVGPQDDIKRLDKDLQCLTDEFIGKIEETCKRKGLQV